MNTIENVEPGKPVEVQLSPYGEFIKRHADGSQTVQNCDAIAFGRVLATWVAAGRQKILFDFDHDKKRTIAAASVLREAQGKSEGFVGFLYGLAALGVAGYGLYRKNKKAIDKARDKLAEVLDKEGEKSDGGGADEVDFSKLSFCWGGVNGANAKLVPGAVIADLRLSGGGMSYRWVSGGCEALGANGGGDYGKTLACLFADGKGGKFDYISTSRTTRSFENINGGYHGWDAGAVGRAKEICFCIVSTDGTMRTNVIKAGV